jgi:hypothetical protein
LMFAGVGQGAVESLLKVWREQAPNPFLA